MVSAWFSVIRPAHWVKNFFVLAPLLFARHLFDSGLLLPALAAFSLFCLLSSSVYLFNDVLDAPQDRLHPIKARRPIAAGLIQPSHALLVAILLALLSLLLAFLLATSFGCVCLGYLILQTAYSSWLKRIAYLDVAIIATGFVLRVVAGAVVISVEISVWLVICTFSLACLLAFGKRRHEVETAAAAQVSTRASLSRYRQKTLRVAEALTAVATIVSYILYTLAPGTVAKFGGYYLVLSSPFAVLGILRYLRLVVARRDRIPTEALVTDLLSLLNLAAWVGTVVVILYLGS